MSPRNPASSRNGWHDNGHQLRNGRTKCPNCGSSNFTESLSRELCRSCGLECDYWGGGANAVYLAYEARRHREQEYREQRRRDEEERREQEALSDWEDY